MVRIEYAGICEIPNENGAQFTIGFTGDITLDETTLSTLSHLKLRKQAIVYKLDEKTLIIQVDYDVNRAAALYEAIKPILSLDGLGRPSGRTVDISNAPALQRV